MCSHDIDSGERRLQRAYEVDLIGVETAAGHGDVDRFGGRFATSTATGHGTAAAVLRGPRVDRGPPHAPALVSSRGAQTALVSPARSVASLS